MLPDSDIFEAIANKNKGGISDLFLKLYKDKIVFATKEKAFYYYEAQCNE
jgi:hypothetical protein